MGNMKNEFSDWLNFLKLLQKLKLSVENKDLEEALKSIL